MTRQDTQIRLDDPKGSGFLLSRCENKFMRDMCWYLIMLVVSMVATVLFGQTIAFMWIANFLMLIFFCSRYCNNPSETMWFLAFLFLGIGLSSLLFNANFLTTNLKTLGLHINLFVTPFYMIFLSSVKRGVNISEDDVDYLLHILSTIGIILIITTFIKDRENLLGIMRGVLRVVRGVSLAGFMWGKNSYGAMVSISLSADMFLAHREPGWKYPLLIFFKIIAVSLSFSRAALLQAVLMLIVFFLLEHGVSTQTRLFLVASALVFAGIYVTTPRIRLFFIDNVLRFSAGDSGRAWLRRRALEKLPQTTITHILGVGYTGVSELSIDIDNAYYYEYFTGGIVRLIFTAVMLIVPFYLMFRVAKQNAALKSIMHICLATHVSYLAYMYFESVAPLELGLLNFSFMLFSYVLPCALFASPMLLSQEKISIPNETAHTYTEHCVSGQSEQPRSTNPALAPNS